MNIHSEETSSMLIGTRKRTKESRPLYIQAGVGNIESVSKQNLLRIHIDENLTWSPHVDNYTLATHKRYHFYDSWLNNVQNLIYKAINKMSPEYILTNSAAHTLQLMIYYMFQRQELCSTRVPFPALHQVLFLK